MKIFKWFINVLVLVNDSADGVLCLLMRNVNEKYISLCADGCRQ
jgi:hypothetical protein